MVNDSHHDRWMLRAAWGATIAAVFTVVAAFLGIYFSSQYNRETVTIARETAKIARDSLIESKKAGDDQRAQFEKERQDAAKELELKEQQSTDAKVHEVRRAEDRQAEIARIELLARSPLLLQYQCCNPVALIVETSNDGSLDFRQPGPDEAGFFSSDHNKDHVIQIGNLGQGPALRVSATWHAEKLKFFNGSEKAISLAFGPYDTKPLHLKSQEHGRLSELPYNLFQEDHSSLFRSRLAEVEGYLELNCDDNANENRTFEYNFTMKVFGNLQYIGPGIRAGAMYIDIAKDERNKPSLPRDTPVTSTGKPQTKSPDLADEKSLRIK